MMYRRQREMGFLKLFVYIMGITLMGCAVFLAYAVYKRINMSLQLPNAVVLSECPSIKNGHMPKVTVEGEILSTDVSGTKVTILSKTDEEYSMTVIDYCLGTTTTLKPIFSKR